MKIDQFDVKALRAFRVLRPLRLVSGVPSKLGNLNKYIAYFLNIPILPKSKMFKVLGLTHFQGFGYLV